MKMKLFLFCCSIYTYTCFAQSGLTVSANNAIAILSGTTFSVDGLSLQPTTDFAITGTNTMVRNTTLQHASFNPSIHRSFLWGSTVTNFNGAIQMFYTDAELNGIPENALTLNIHDGTIWRAYTAGVTRDGVNNHILTTSLGGVDFRELSLASVSTPLPLKWGATMAFRKDAHARIDWETQDETLIVHFQVEASLDGISWRKVGAAVPGKNQPRQWYQVIDTAITSHKTFYRVRMTEVTGHASYSNVIAVQALHRLAEGPAVYPNPALHFVNLQYFTAGIMIKQAVIFNAEGKKVVQANGLLSSKAVIDISRLPAGTYFIRAFLSDGTTDHFTFLKQ
jgi:hypothetical protein